MLFALEILSWGEVSGGFRISGEGRMIGGQIDRGRKYT